MILLLLLCVRCRLHVWPRTLRHLEAEISQVTCGLIDVAFEHLAFHDNMLPPPPLEAGSDPGSFLYNLAPHRLILRSWSYTDSSFCPILVPRVCLWILRSTGDNPPDIYTQQYFICPNSGRSLWKVGGIRDPLFSPPEWHWVSSRKVFTFKEDLKAGKHPPLYRPLLSKFLWKPSQQNWGKLF